ncbi:MAG: pyridoxamine 5'-phosphate oxidase family protein [Pseudomonadota bacterium]
MNDTKKNTPDFVWALVKKIGITMFTTRSGDEFDARPLQAYPDPAAGQIVYMTDSTHVLSQVAADGRVLLSLVDKGHNDYVTLTGQAVISNDRDKIKRLWSVWAEAYWKSAQDPAIRLIIVTPEHARYWEAPNSVVATVAMLAGVLTGTQPKLGTSGELQL